MELGDSFNNSAANTAGVQIARSSISFLGCCAGGFFACRAIFVLVTARWIYVGTEPGVLAQFAISIVLFLMALIAACGPNSCSIGLIFRSRSVRWVSLYLLFACCSLLWSGTASPAASFVYCCELLLDVSTVFLLLRTTEAQCAAHSIMKGFIVGTLVLATIAWIMPTAEDLRLGDLDYFNTNQIANLCALSILMGTLLATRGDSMPKFVSPILVLTLFRSLSKATLISFIAAQIYRFASDSGMSVRRKWLLLSTGVVLTLGFWSLMDAYFGLYTTTGNQAETLTGRTAIWAWTLDAALAKPLFGNGFDAMWKVAPPFGGDMFEARHAENELLQQFFSYGMCGVALLIGIYSSLYRRCRLHASGSERSALISFLVFVLVRGLAEAEPFDLLLPLWLIVCLTPIVESSVHAGGGANKQFQEICTESAVSAG